MKNRGLDLEKQKRDEKPTDYILGAETPRCVVPISKDEFLKYLPKGELQFGREDFMDCATRSPNNNLEAKLNKFVATYPFHAFTTWLISKGYVNPQNKVELSDRFTAILSGTTRQGNSLVAPLHTIHKTGIIPKKLLPREENMTWDEYHDKTKITQVMLELGQESLSWIDITYWKTDLKARDDIACTAGHAWPQPIEGVYLKTEEQFNHAFITEPQYVVFDNYEESPDDFIKELAPDYNLLPGYRLVIQLKKNEDTELKQEYENGNHYAILCKKVWEFIKSIWFYLF